jgi:hypothetical protein
MKKWLLRFLVLFITFTFVIYIWFAYQTRDRFPKYEMNLQVEAKDEPGEFSVGFGAISITPEITETWTDADSNAVFNPEQGDTFNDANQNGKFDTYWIAGFGKGRAANGVNDELWARAMVIDDGQTRYALVVLDAIGFGNDDVIRVRKRIESLAELDYVTVASTHTHEAPDLIGLWGPEYLSSGVDPIYLEMVVSGAAQAVAYAASTLEPAYLVVGQDLESASDLVADTREPQVLDPALHIIKAVARESGRTLGSLIAWADHPETTWSQNLRLSSDFVHYVRQGVEKGIYHGDKLVHEGLGGTAVYVNGAIGGLMTTHPSTPIKDPFNDTTYLEPSFDKAKAQGENLAIIALKSLESADTIREASFELIAKSVTLPLSNTLYQLGAGTGVLQRGTPSWMMVRSEIAFWQFGPISCMQLPGEIYPEIINGGVEAPEGQDFALEPIETPPLRSLMPGKYKLVFGLANDMIGYVVPKSQWDEEPPFTYENTDAPYGEINSLGPETAPILYREMADLLKK